MMREGAGWDNEVGESVTVGASVDSQAGFSLQSDEPVVVGSVESDTRFSAESILDEQDIVSGISVVIGSHGDPWGVLGTHSTDRRSYTSDDVNFVQNIANILAEAIERTRTEEELRETHDRYHRILKQLSDYVIIVDGAGEITYASPAIERTMGYGSDAVVGTNAFEYVHPEDHEIALEAFSETIEDPEHEVRVEYRAKAADGSYRWIEARGNNYLDDPVIQVVLVSVRDISERKALEPSSD
jgi:PAS domain S-box-containing protein